ncbi:MAG: MFS transporter [Thermoplasmata archaeon]|nr:MFS transporter [Thermoplasmata archaeon]
MQYKWKALAVVTAGSLMSAIDGTVVVIAFPPIARDLSASLAAMVWVIMIYILMGTALVLPLGRVADMKGRKRLYLAGFGVFVLGSALCGLAQSGLELVAFRGVQGVGGAMILANSFAILSTAFPPGERGEAFGINAVVWGIGAIAGIVVGGLILTVAGWRWIFWINLPIGVATIAAAYYILQESVTPDPRESFDFPAAILLTAGLAALLLGVTEGILMGWTDPLALAPIAFVGPLFGAFLYWEARVSRDPIVPFGLFRDRLFTASLSASLLQGMATMAANFLLMTYFQGIRGISVLTAAYLLAPLPIMLAIVGPIGGRLADRLGARIVSTVGLVLQASVLAIFATLNAGTPLAEVALLEAGLGIGGGLFFPANNTAIVSGVPRPRLGVATGVMMTVRNSATALSYAMTLLALTSQLPRSVATALFGGALTPSDLGRSGLSSAAFGDQFLVGFRLAFAVSAALVALAAVVSVLRGREAHADEFLPHRRGRRRPSLHLSEDRAVVPPHGGV